MSPVSHESTRHTADNQFLDRKVNALAKHLVRWYRSGPTFAPHRNNATRVAQAMEGNDPFLKAFIETNFGDRHPSRKELITVLTNLSLATLVVFLGRTFVLKLPKKYQETYTNVATRFYLWADWESGEVPQKKIVMTYSDGRVDYDDGSSDRPNY